MTRFEVVHRLLSTVPLATPVHPARLTSRFGARRDPFSGEQALHSGVDLGGTPDGRVRATAPGRVVAAAPQGAYGVLVEIDHGMGIHTRYAHLRKALVRVGERVGFRTPIGIMGDTGRSTGVHVHYEVRVDDRPLDPAAFMAAGSHLRRLFEG